MKQKFAALAGLMLVTLLLASTLTAASVSVVVSDFTHQDSPVQSLRYQQATFKVTNIGTSVESGLLELQASRTAGAPLLSFVSGVKNCEPGFPYNVHKDYTVNPGESVTFVLQGRNIPSGTYWPVVTHATGCFNSGGVPIDPISWGKRISSTAVTFGAASANVNDQCDNNYEAGAWLSDHGTMNCLTAVCNNPDSSSSSASCTKYAECNVGAVQSVTCAAGNTIDVRKCLDGMWTATDAKCPGEVIPAKPGDPPANTTSLFTQIKWGLVLTLLLVIFLLVVIGRRLGWFR
jgi:hypothetical protein